MRTSVTVAAAVVLVLALAAAAVRPADPPERETHGVFAALEVGQRITLRDLNTVYEIRLLPGDQPGGHEVVSVGHDHVVVRDAAGVTTTTIPVYSVKCIVRLDVDRERPGAGR